MCLSYNRDIVNNQVTSELIEYLNMRCVYLLSERIHFILKVYKYICILVQI